MQQLTGLDAAFLALEEAPGTYGHVGSVIVADPSTSPEPFDLDHLQRLIASRLHLIHGLEDGNIGIYTKVHHAAIDGVSGNDVLAAVIDVTPQPRDVGEVPQHLGERPPSTLGMLAHSAWSIAKMSYEDSVFYGFTADRDLVPDLDVLGRHAEEELADLKDALSA